jgi:M6 family metalloprotease-like protein
MKHKHYLILVLISLLIFHHQIFATIKSDSLRVLGIRVEFEEDDSPNTSGNGKFDLSESTDPFQIDPPPHNKFFFEDHLIFLKNYFYRVSKGQLILTGDIFPFGENEAYQLNKAMTYYNPNETPEKNNTRLAELFRDAVLSADADLNLKFADYQSIIVFHAGVGKDVEVGFDDTPQDIPSIFITPEFLCRYLGDSSIVVDDGQMVITNGIIAPETESQGGIELGLNGIVTSNFGSQLGWQDLFSPETRRTGIGRFGLMDVGLFNGDGLLPAIPCAWTRFTAGWEKPIRINYASNDKYTIFHSLSTNDERIYRFPINDKEYFLVENRYSGGLNFDSLQYALSQNRSDYANTKEVLLTFYEDQVTFSSSGVLVDVENPDIGLPNSGCLIWHIDENVIDRTRATNRVNADPEHRGVDLEEADGSEDIGQNYTFLDPGYGSELGWALDMWYLGNSAPLFKNEFSINSVPNSRSYLNRANSHIKIFDFSVADSTMTFWADFNIFQMNFPKNIDPEKYGRIISSKTADLNFDEKGELIFVTDSGKILAINESGNSVWGSDSFMVAQLDDELLSPPVFFDNPLVITGQSKGMIVLSHIGNVYGFTFSSELTFDTLFTPIRIGSMVTTHPVAEYLVGNSVGIYWGCENGRVYQITIDQNSISLDSLNSVNEPIEFLHLNGKGQIVILTNSGKVYMDNQFIKQTEIPYFTPVGFEAVGLTRNGQFLNFESDIGTVAEHGIFHFDSPLIAWPAQQYYVTGNNQIYSYNYNFTLTNNFPVQINLPYEEKWLPISPLINNFYNAGLNEVYGVIVTDPAGLIDGFDLQGKRLADFPLPLGDSIIVSPVILDIDQDTDVEIAVVSKQGKLFVWDLASSFKVNGWNQIYYDELNHNLTSTVPVDQPVQGNHQLLPEGTVYNWPNPNRENYTFIRYYLSEQAEVNIKIYDLAGDLVAELLASENPHTANEVRWDLVDIQSGVYLARIEAKSSYTEEVHFIKIAVVK